MEGNLQGMGTAPAAPTLMVGRDGDLAAIRKLLNRRAPGDRVRLSGSRLRELRGKRSWTQDGLADKARVSLKTVRNAEAGLAIRRTSAAPIAERLQVPLEELVASSVETPVGVLVVVRGVPGVGKTTLAKALAHDPQIVRSTFNCSLWASLGQAPDLRKVLSSWARSLGVVGIPPEADEAEVGHRLAALLRDQRVLVIIDDAWTVEDVQTLMVGGASCATLVTTRITEVADAIASVEDDLHVLEVLTESAAVALLEALARTAVSGQRPAARELANDLERLPLALQVAGCLLREEARNGLGVTNLLIDLRDAAKLLPQPVPADLASGHDRRPTVSALFSKSTDVLPAEARKCFSYLAPHAPKPAKFTLDAMTASWKTISVDAKRMADLLVRRGLLEPVGVGRFWMHAMLRAHAESILLGKSTTSRPS